MLLKTLVAVIVYKNSLNQISKRKYMSKDEEDSFKANLLATAHNFCNVSLDQNLMMNTKEVRVSLKKIKLIDEIVTTKPDKDSEVVVLNKDEYINKMLLKLFSLY